MEQKTAEQAIELGRTGIQVSPLGIGAWAWGDRVTWEYGRTHREEDVQEAFTALLESGINFFDTAEVYGLGRSEQILGELARGAGAEVVIASKFMPFPWRLWKGRLINALKNSLERLGLSQVDLYQIHFPLPPIPIKTWMDALADAVEQGLIRSAGVSNFNENQMRQAHQALASRGVPLASNQVEYSLLKRKPERNGVLEACQELGVTLIAYSPLAQGLLTGKYTPENPLPGVRGRRYRRSLLSDIQPLLETMREIGQGHGGKTIPQVALNWTICKGTLPIPGAKNARQAADNAGALGWRMAPEEMAALDAASRRVQG